MKKLELLSFPFKQNTLIEASAGTGKTYTISNLFLRLLLGHRCKARNVSEILVLTFTNAATAELKERILTVIRQAWRDFVRAKSQDPFIMQLIQELPDREHAARRLLIASQEMDLASVFTIHGFCQRVLTEYAFESGSAWQEELLLDDSDLLLVAVTDYWRRFVANMTPEEARWLLKQWSSPEVLAKTLRPVLYRDIGSEDPQHLLDNWQSLKGRYQQLLQDTKNWWRDNDISAVLENAGLKANVKIARKPFLNMMRNFASGQLHTPDLGKDGWLTLSPEKILKARKKTSDPIDESSFERFVELAELETALDSARRQYYFWHSLVFVREHLKRNKMQKAELSPDDLLSRVKSALVQSTTEDNKNTTLVSLIREKFPIAMVDEFQDTDQTQFDIFRTIYHPVAHDTSAAQQTLLIMIGDPKQAIYSFRGGDIYTYLQAREFVREDARYTLATNWRSQPSLVAAVNAFFAESKTGFMHSAMPFNKVEAGRTENHITHQQAALSAISCRVLPSIDNGKGEEPVKWNIASEQMAEQCAAAVAYYLSEVQVNKQAIRSSDVCILVRDRYEANIIQGALQSHGIDSVFLLKDTVFNSPVTYSLLLILIAIYECQSEAKIKAALLDEIFGFNHTGLQILNNDPLQWQETLKVFHQANDIWSRRGVMSAVEFVCRTFSVYEQIKSGFEKYQRTLTDLRHLCEILQLQSARIEGKTALISWYQQRVARPELLASDGLDDTQWRLDTDQNLVQICTIHGSKGLQYPFVFIPFVSRYKDSQSLFYHDDQQTLRFNVTKDETTTERQNNERIAEDIRLLYVALTRAQSHCWLGIWDNNIAGRKVASGFVNTAFGRLLDILDGDISDIDTAEVDIVNGSSKLSPNIAHQGIISRLEKRFAGQSVDIQLVDINEYPCQSGEKPKDRTTEKRLSHLSLSEPVTQSWQMTSYSAISKTRMAAEQEPIEELKAADETLNLPEDMNEMVVVESSPIFLTELPMRFRFARGASPGSYLHEVLEHCDFNQQASIEKFAVKYREKYSIPKEDVPEVSAWLSEVLHSPLTESPNQSGYSLADIQKSHQVAEMEFFLPLEQVNVTQFNRLVSEWLPDFDGQYQIAQLNGMLKGYLDLVYIKDAQLFVADYKSNFLGDNFQDYQQAMLKDAMMHHDYYLQALLYTLAMHRFLQNKLQHYQYDKHIGGAQYLFLRGMCPELPGNGILTVKPPEALILKLDGLFANTGDIGEALESAVQTHDLNQVAGGRPMHG